MRACAASKHRIERPRSVLPRRWLAAGGWLDGWRDLQLDPADARGRRRRLAPRVLRAPTARACGSDGFGAAGVCAEADYREGRLRVFALLLGMNFESKTVR